MTGVVRDSKSAVTLALVHTDLVVAAYAEVTVGAVDLCIDKILQCHICRAELRIRVLRNRPLAVVPGVTSAARGRGRIAALGK